MKKRNIKVWMLTGALCLAAVGGATAYLTDYDQVKNEFVVGKVDIDLEEPGWNPEDQKEIVPGKEIEKDPQITNAGKNDAYVYLQVSVPMAEVTAADKDGNRLERKRQELFSFTAKAGWTKIENKEENGAMIYVYSYDKILKPKETTGTLFDTVTFLNVIEGQVDEQTLMMPVKAFAIQTLNTGDDKATVPEQARAAYTKYLNQNKGQENVQDPDADENEGQKPDTGEEKEPGAGEEQKPDTGGDQEPGGGEDAGAETKPGTDDTGSGDGGSGGTDTDGASGAEKDSHE